MQSLKQQNDLGLFQGKTFNITVIQVYAPTSNAEEAEVEWFYEDLQDILELRSKEICPFHHRELECKHRKSKRYLEKQASLVLVDKMNQGKG